MQEAVQTYLNKCAEKNDAINQNYHYRVLEYAKLLNKDEADYVEVTPTEYRISSYQTRKKDGHYYLKKPLAMDVTEEEFTAIESTIPPEKLQEMRLLAEGKDVHDDYSGTSGSASFLTALAWLIWIGGLIISVITANVSVNNGYRSSTEFNFALFISTFTIYLLSGAFCMCFAELFRKLQTIVNLLYKKK